VSARCECKVAKAKGCRTESFEMEIECSGVNVNQTIRIAGINMHRMDPQSDNTRYPDDIACYRERYHYLMLTSTPEGFLCPTFTPCHPYQFIRLYLRTSMKTLKCGELFGTFLSPTHASYLHTNDTILRVYR
jgi:hypothetical protein